jgi:hypothetical protein
MTEDHHNPADQTRLGPVQGKIRDDVARQRWSWIWVFDPDRSASPFAYTIGLASSFDHPEVLVAGLPRETSGGILGAVQAMIASGHTYADGDVSDDILDGFAVRFRSIPQDLLIGNLVQAAIFHGDRTFDALQLIWPDPDGKFPGEENATPWLADRQALAY